MTRLKRFKASVLLEAFRDLANPRLTDRVGQITSVSCSQVDHACAQSISAAKVPSLDLDFMPFNNDFMYFNNVNFYNQNQAYLFHKVIIGMSDQC